MTHQILMDRPTVMPLITVTEGLKVVLEDQ